MNLSLVDLHLALNHSPLFGELFAFALMAIGLLSRKQTLVTAGLVIAILSAGCAYAAVYTGDGAESFIKQSPPIPGVDKALIEPHAQAADYLATASYITAGLAFISLIIGWRRASGRFRWLTTAASWESSSRVAGG